MDELLLRINRTGVKMKHSNMNVPVVDLTKTLGPEFCKKHALYEKLVTSALGDEQFRVLRSILEDYEELPDYQSVLVRVYVAASLKHPIKSIITKFVNTKEAVGLEFSAQLKSEIEGKLLHKPDHKLYLEVVTILTGCLQNFPIGAAVVKELESKLIHYLSNALQYCVTDIRNQETSPSYKNMLYSTLHSTLNILHHCIQKLESTTLNPDDHRTILRSIKYVMADENAPMDTKCLSGKVLLSLYVHEHGPGSWIWVFSNKDFTSDTDRAILLSAVATSTSLNELEYVKCNGQPVIVELALQFLNIGLSNATNTALNLTCSRAMLQLCRYLPGVGVDVAGCVVDSALKLAWTQLEHSADNVKHLAQAMLLHVADYCVQRDPSSKGQLFAQLSSLDREKRAFYLTLSALAAHAPVKEVFEQIPDLLDTLLAAVAMQPLQACAKACLESILDKYQQSHAAEAVYQQWIVPILQYIREKNPEAIVLNVLTSLIVNAVKKEEGLVEYIVPLISDAVSKLHSMSVGEISALLMLVKAANVKPLPYSLLRATAELSSIESGVLTLSLIVDSQKQTQILSDEDFEVMLHYLEYHVGDCNPNTRHLTLASVKKFLTRYSESYRVLLRQCSQSLTSDYLKWLEGLRSKCFGWLFPGANAGRRHATLQILAWTEQLEVKYDRNWCERDVTSVARCLDDSFDKNKKLALHILQSVPKDMLLRVCTNLDLLPDRSLSLAGSEKPHQCSSAAHALLVFAKLLPDSIDRDEFVPEGAYYTLLSEISRRLRRGLNIAPHCGAAASSAPMYGLVHCARVLFDEIDVSVISSDSSWKSLIASLILISQSINEVVMPVVAHCSPEGLILPQQIIKYSDEDGFVFETSCDADFENNLTDVKELSTVKSEFEQLRLDTPCDRNNDRIHLPNGEDFNENLTIEGDLNENCKRFTKAHEPHPVYVEKYQNLAQKLLLCAWRCIKETSLLLGSISQRLSISGTASGILEAEQLVSIAEHLGSVLERARHRGAFEQAHVGFCMTVGRMWASENALLREWPRQRVDRLLHTVRCAELHTASRRSAGLPYMLQALVTTELQATGNRQLFTWCMDELLTLADETDEDLHHTTISENKRATELSPRELRNETRAHSLNVLRAMYRNTTLGEVVTERLAEGLMVAIRAFDADNWKVRNSATLLFSTLMVRIFGVMRTKQTVNLDVRNRMTGRIFFLRYPKLFDFMLDRLSRSDEVRQTTAVDGRKCSVFTILLVLGRLYPSPLEGTSTNLKLVEFIPLVSVCGGSGQQQTRELAARALVPLVPSHQFVFHLEVLFEILHGQARRNSNLTHGILLQIKHLLSARAEPLPRGSTRVLSSLLSRSRQLLRSECRPVLQAYYDILALIAVQFPSLLDEESVEEVLKAAYELLFQTNHIPFRSVGKELCEVSALHVLIILSSLHNKNNTSRKSKEGTLRAKSLQTVNIVERSLVHPTSDVTTTVLDYILFLHDIIDDDNDSLSEKLTPITDKKLVLEQLNSDGKYFGLLSKIVKNNSLEAVVSKALRVLSLTHVGQEYLVTAFGYTKYNILEHLLDLVESKSVHTSVFLHCVLDRVRTNQDIGSKMLRLMRVIYENCMADVEVECREEVAGFLADSLNSISTYKWEEASDVDHFEYQALLWCSLATLASDDDEDVRQRAADAVSPTLRKLPSWAAHRIPELIVQCSCDAGEATALLLALALLDFRAEVRLDDDDDENGRVFDLSERHNVYLEETLWTELSARHLQTLHPEKTVLRDNIKSCLEKYRETLSALARDNLTYFLNEINGERCNVSRVKCFVELLGLCF